MFVLQLSAIKENGQFLLYILGIKLIITLSSITIKNETSCNRIKFSHVSSVPD